MNIKNLLFIMLFCISMQASSQVNPCNCVILDSNAYICVQDTFGNTFQVPNECFADCLGFTPSNLPCDSLFNNCICDQSYNPVCVEDEFGNFFEAPNVCFAECWGYTIVSDSLCDINIDPWNCDCDFTNDSIFVCAQDSIGNYFQVPNACIAACWGLTIVPDSLCQFPGNNCLCPQVYEPVCALNASGVIVSFPNSCLAACWGYSIVSDSLCDLNIDPWNCDCSFTNDTIFVCAQDSLGNYFQVPNACIAACWGLTIVPDSLCQLPGNNCLCPQVYAPVCAQDASGVVSTFQNSCYAECFGFTVIDSAFCDNIFGSCNCTVTSLDSLLCAQDTFGNFYQVPNACFAACWGLTIVDSGCEVNNHWDNCDCPIVEGEAFVCAQDSSGYAQYVPNACFAACLGLTVVSNDSCDIVVIDPELDSFNILCIESIINADTSILFQNLLLAISASCGLELHACISNAPIFQTDAEFIDYLLNECNGDFGLNNNDGSNVFNLYNMSNAILNKVDDKLKNEFSVKLNENPVSSLLKFELSTNKAQKAQAKIIDLNGQLLKSNYLNLNAGSNIFNIEVDNIKSGLYLLNVNSDQMNKTIKFIIAR